MYKDKQEGWRQDWEAAVQWVEPVQGKQDLVTLLLGVSFANANITRSKSGFG